MAKSNVNMNAIYSVMRSICNTIKIRKVIFSQNPIIKNEVISPSNDSMVPKDIMPLEKHI